MKHTWTKTVIVLLLTAALMFSLSTAAMAEDGAPLDLGADVTLTVAPGPSSMLVDGHILAADVVYDVYKVADAVQDTGMDSYHYSLCAAFANIQPTGMDIQSYAGLTGMTRESWKQLAFAAAETVFTASTTPAAALANVSSADSMTLGGGLYLLIAHSDGVDMADYVKRDENGELLGTIARAPQFEYTYAPELFSLPASAETIPAVYPDNAATADPYTSAGGHWFYTVSAMLKPSEDARDGVLVIEKDLTVYNSAGPVSFVFFVEAALNNAGVYSDYHMLTFTAPGKQSLSITLPVGATVSVTEVYQGAGCTLTGTVWSNLPTSGAHEVKPVESGDPLTVTFTNRYDNKVVQGSGILNQYVFEKLSETDPGEWTLDTQSGSNP